MHHRWLLDAEIRTGFRSRQLKLHMDLRCASRISCFGKAASEPIIARQASLPSYGWATVLLELILLEPLDRLL